MQNFFYCRKRCLVKKYWLSHTGWLKFQHYNLFYTTVLYGPWIWLAGKCVDIRVQQTFHRSTFHHLYHSACQSCRISHSECHGGHPNKNNNNNISVTECSFKSILGENVLVWTSNMRFVNKDNIYLKICLNVLVDVSSRASAIINLQRERLISARSSGIYSWLWRLYSG